MLKAGTNEQVVIRTCTVSKLIDSDGSISSFTIKSEDGTDINVVSGLIASCKEDGCNSAINSQKNLNNRFFVLISLFTLINIKL